MGFQRGIKSGEHVSISGLKNGGKTSNKTVKLQLVRSNPELGVLLHVQRLVDAGVLLCSLRRVGSHWTVLDVLHSD
jgi:hypothetical protein